MTGVHAAAGFFYQVNVAIYCVLRSILAKRFVSCSLEVDVELATGSAKSVDLWLKQKTPLETVHCFEIKDAMDLNQESRLRDVVNDLFTTFANSQVPIHKTYIVHSAPTDGALALLRDVRRKGKKISEYRRYFHEQIGNTKFPPKGRPNKKHARTVSDYAAKQVTTEQTTMDKFTDSFNLLHLPTCMDRRLTVTDLELRIESVVREFYLGLHRHNLNSDFRDVRIALFDHVKSQITKASLDAKFGSKYSNAPAKALNVTIDLDAAFQRPGSIYSVFVKNGEKEARAWKDELHSTYKIPLAQLGTSFGTYTP